MLPIRVIKIGVQGPAGPQGNPGSDAAVTTANLLAALATAPLSNAEKATYAAAIGFPVYATKAFANAGLAEIGRPYWNSTLHRYEITDAAA